MSTKQAPPKTKVSNSKNQQITFRFSKLCLDNVPFCNKTLSLRFHSKFFSQGTDPTPVEKFSVSWKNTVEIKKNITFDSVGKLLPMDVDVTVLTHSVKGSGKNEIARGKIDLASLARSGVKAGNVQMMSNILESTLSFDVEIYPDSLVEAQPEQKQIETLELPEIHVIMKNSWFNVKHNPDLIEQDANILVEAALKPKTK